jgi:trimethylamine--corrinoid protein Co-methyltransferase
VTLFDLSGRQTHEIGGDRVYFVPGSAATSVLDGGAFRPPTTADYVRYARVVGSLPHLAAQSTAFVPADVPAGISDSYRLYLSLLFCDKPVVTGAFSPAGLPVMLDLQIAVRGDAGGLRERPLAIYSCCPTAPLEWSLEASRALVSCARAGIPVEIVPMPLAGLVAPVTLADALVQHAAEALSGVAIAQLASPGAPLLFGGATAIFDVRNEVAPVGAIESMMLVCAGAEVGRHLGLPTQGYIALSDAKDLDVQCGLETGIGATLAALSGINSISGPGMLDMLNGFSLEKLVFDHAICGMALRARRGIEPCPDADLSAAYEELLRDGQLMVARHTRRHLRHQIGMADPVVDRASRGRWIESGARTAIERARLEIAALERLRPVSSLDSDVRRELASVMRAEARRSGMDALPELPCDS